MKGWLYRFTPAGGKPNHYTDSLLSASKGDVSTESTLLRLKPGDQANFANGSWERIA